MPVYEFSCGCGQESSTHRSMSDNTTDKTCPGCGEAMNRRFSCPGVKLSMQPHYNWSLGRYVSSARDFEDGLKAASETATLRTGVEHRFVPTDPSDHSQGTEGLEEQQRARRDLNLTQSTKTIFS